MSDREVRPAGEYDVDIPPDGSGSAHTPPEPSPPDTPLVEAGGRDEGNPAAGEDVAEVAPADEDG